MRAKHLVLFYGLDVENTVILAVRQITDRLSHRGVNGADWRVRTGKGGRYSYYSCNGKVSAGAARCICPHAR